MIHWTNLENISISYRRIQKQKYSQKLHSAESLPDTVKCTTRRVYLSFISLTMGMQHNYFSESKRWNVAQHFLCNAELFNIRYKLYHISFPIGISFHFADCSIYSTLYHIITFILVFNYTLDIFMCVISHIQVLLVVMSFSFLVGWQSVFYIQSFDVMFVFSIKMLSLFNKTINIYTKDQYIRAMPYDCTITGYNSN